LFSSFNTFQFYYRVQEWNYTPSPAPVSLLVCLFVCLFFLYLFLCFVIACFLSSKWLPLASAPSLQIQIIIPSRRVQIIVPVPQVQIILPVLRAARWIRVSHARKVEYRSLRQEVEIVACKAVVASLLKTLLLDVTLPQFAGHWAGSLFTGPSLSTIASLLQALLFFLPCVQTHFNELTFFSVDVSWHCLNYWCLGSQYGFESSMPCFLQYVLILDSHSYLSALLFKIHAGGDLNFPPDIEVRIKSTYHVSFSSPTHIPIFFFLFFYFFLIYLFIFRMNSLQGR